MIDKTIFLKEISSDQKNLPPFRTANKLLVSDFNQAGKHFKYASQTRKINYVVNQTEHPDQVDEFRNPIKHELKTMCDSTPVQNLKMNKFVTMELIIR